MVLAAALVPAGLTLRVPRALYPFVRGPPVNSHAHVCVCHTALCDFFTCACAFLVFPHITSFVRSQPQGAKEVLFPFFFFKDDKCTDINIFLVPTVRLFSKIKRGRSWLFLHPHWFYLSWTFQTSSVPWFWGSYADPPCSLRCFIKDLPPASPRRWTVSPVLPLDRASPLSSLPGSTSFSGPQFSC